MATAELILGSAIDTLTRRPFVVSNLFGKLQAEALQAPSFGLQFFGQRLVTAGVDIDQWDVAECAAVLADLRRIVGGIHQVIQIVYPLGGQGGQWNGGLAVVQRGGRQ